MAREYFCCYHSYLEVMEQLNDTERGRLFTACLTYSKTGEAPELRGNERFVFPAFRSQIDRDNANYEETCRKRSKSASTRWNANDANASKCISDDANDAKEKEKEKEKEKTKAKTNTKANTSPPLPPSGGNAPAPEQPEVDLSGLSPTMQAKLNVWLAYKKERRESYKPTGLQALVTRICSSVERYGERAVCDLIDNSMSSGYQGILFDRLQQQAGKGRKEMVPAWADKPSQFAQDAVQRMMAQAQTAGNDPALAERAERLRERLEGN